MDMARLETFMAVARHLNFTRAAEQLNLAQSSVSAQVRNLEEDLGVKLFERIGRRVLLTPAGDKLLQYSLRMRDMEREIRSELSEARELAGSLTIRVPETLASVYMPPVTERFRRDYPRAQLRYINCTDQRLRQELHSGRIDLAFLMIEGVNFHEVTVELLGEEELVMAAAPSHPLAQQAGLTLSDLQGETLLLSGSD